MRSLNILILSVLIISNAYCQNFSVSAGDIVDKIKSNLTCEWTDETVDTFKSGSRESIVTGIATTFLSNLDVLQRAKADGLNMVITHEPTFYNHLDDKAQFGDDPVLAAKLKFIEENNMIVWRFHDHWHRTDPDGIYEGILKKYGWNEYQKEQSLYVIPETTLGKLVSNMKLINEANAIRVVGNPDMVVRNVAICPGAPGSMTQIEMLKREDVQVLIAGEAPEWETTEYVRDAIAAGMDKAIIFLGHAISEEPGMEYCAQWLRNFISEVRVEFVPAQEPFWIPE